MNEADDQWPWRATEDDVRRAYDRLDGWGFGADESPGGDQYRGDERLNDAARYGAAIMAAELNAHSMTMLDGGEFGERRIDVISDGGEIAFFPTRRYPMVGLIREWVENEQKTVALSQLAALRRVIDEIETELTPQGRMTDPFTIGDTVSLRSGGTAMTVDAIGPEWVRCNWIDESGRGMNAVYSPHCLARIERRQVVIESGMYRCVWCFADSGFPIADHILIANPFDGPPV